MSDYSALVDNDYILEMVRNVDSFINIPNKYYIKHKARTFFIS